MISLLTSFSLFCNIYHIPFIRGKLYRLKLRHYQSFMALVSGGQPLFSVTQVISIDHILLTFISISSLVRFKESLTPNFLNVNAIDKTPTLLLISTFSQPLTGFEITRFHCIESYSIYM